MNHPAIAAKKPRKITNSPFPEGRGPGGWAREAILQCSLDVRKGPGVREVSVTQQVVELCSNLRKSLPAYLGQALSKRIGL
jgi:hypothetical protein